MKLKKVLSLLLAVVLVASAAAIAMAESTDTTQTTAAETEAAVTEETTETETEATYTSDEMLTAVMADAYARQAAYAAYAEAFTDSKSLANLDIHSEIVLLEMLLKANDVALPQADTAVTVPETLADTYSAVAQAETDAVTMLKTYLAQETLGEDAQMIFRTVLSDTYETAVSFTSKARVAQQEQEWTNIMNDENTKVVVVNNGGRGGHGQQTVYVYTNSTDETEDAADTTDTTDTTTEDSVSD